MAKQPTRRKTIQRPVRQRAAPEPQNTSRGAGAPVPESAASERVPASFYEPEPESSQRPASAASAALGADFADGTEQRNREFARETRAQAIEHDGISADISVARQMLGEEPGVERTLDEDIARIREMRRPLGQHAQKLYLPVRHGYKRHWFNDEGGRIDDALTNGWAHVKDKDGKPYRRAVGRGRDQGVLYAYAMELPEVFWLEELAAKHKIAADKMDALKAAPVRSQRGQSQRSDAGKFYSPVEGEDIISAETY